MKSSNRWRPEAIPTEISFTMHLEAKQVCDIAKFFRKVSMPKRSRNRQRKRFGIFLARRHAGARDRDNALRPAEPRASGSDSSGSVMTVPAAAVSMTPAPSMTPAVPAPAAIIPAVVPMPPKRPIVASVAVIARIVAVAVAGTTVIAAVPWIVAAAKRENYLRLSRALGCKEQAACCDQNKKRFHAWNLMPASESRI